MNCLNEKRNQGVLNRTTGPKAGKVCFRGIGYSHSTLDILNVLWLFILASISIKRIKDREKITLIKTGVNCSLKTA